MPRIRSLDCFCLVNLILFAIIAFFLYSKRFVALLGHDRILEFLIYSALIFAATIFLWFLARRLVLRIEVLIILQIGVLLHYAGGFVDINGVRMYDLWFLFGLRYDKYVHFYNAFAVGMLVLNILQCENVALGRLEAPAIVLIVLGLGAIVEMGEYLVTWNVPTHGVGTYDNNIQDLMANALGGLTLAALCQYKKFKALMTPRR